MSTLRHLFRRRGRSRALAKFGTVLGVLALLLLLLPGGEAQAQPVVIATIPSGGGDIGAVPSTNKIYVAQDPAASVAVINGATNTVVGTIGTSGFHTIAVNPVTNRVYISQQFAGSVLVIDSTTDTLVTNFPVPGLLHTISVLAVNPATNRIYVVRTNNNDVSVHDGVTHAQLATIPFGPPSGPGCPIPCDSGGIAVNPTTNRIYVSNNVSNKVTVIDGGTNSVVTTIPVGVSPLRLEVNPVTNRIYVPNAGSTTISVIDGTPSSPTENTVVATISVGVGPLDVGVNPNTNRIYVSNNGSNDVSVIDGSTNTVVAMVPVGLQPSGVTVIPSTNRVYVSNDGPNTVSVIQDLIDTTPPVVNVSFPSPDGQNGWFVTSAVMGSVTADDTTTGGSNITDITCAGATVGSITGLGTPSASAPLTVSAESVNNVSCTATDSAGNSGAGAGSNNTSTVQIDTVASAILITSPAGGGSYLLNAAVASSYNCTDATSGVATCNGPVVSGANFSTSPVGAHAFTVTATDVAGNQAQATNTYNVIYNFSGFFPPVDNPPTLNGVKAGSAIPVKFSLNGDQGLSIFDAGFPASQRITCDTSAPQDVIEETTTAGSSSLSYDAITDQYVYVWKTNKGWAGTCRKLIVQLNDGTAHLAYFKFR